MSQKTEPLSICFEPAVYSALRVRAAETGQSISALVNEAVRVQLAADLEDLAAFDERATEPTMSWQALVNELKIR